MAPTHIPDPWDRLREFTAARIALGRAGGSLPTAESLKFQLHHARAIDAVFTEMARDDIAAALEAAGIDAVPVESRADTRDRYLQRPDLGRRLDAASEERLAAAADDGCDVVVAIVDGLSGSAVNNHAAPVAIGLVETLRARGLRVGPAPVVRHGRVALQDPIGVLMKAQVVVSLIGERPGLGTPDSMGAYLVYNPRAGNTDAQRNCVSNIRPEGLDYPAAIETLVWLVTTALARQVSGIELKDDRQLLAGEDRGMLA